MLKLLSILIIALYSILPTSPIQAALSEMEMSADILGWLNWFIPFDNARTITLAWLSCILAYYVYMMVKKIIMEYIIGKLMLL